MAEGRDLKAVFGTNDRGVAATEAFTNRQAQWEAFAAALTEHLRQVAAPGFDPQDLEAPRRNLLVFHGIGGIGKTTLSRTIEAALATDDRPAQWARPAWSGPRPLPVRIDLARSAGTDFERLVLTIRLALTATGRALPAFDLALRRYWDANHPGEPLEDFLRRGGLSARFGQVFPEQVQSVLADVAQALMLPGTVGAAVGQVTGALTRALREHRQSVRALAGCARLADLLEAEPTVDALSYYPHLLAYEVAQLPARAAVTPVVLLDTFEDTGDRTHRDLERLIQRVVWLMPNVFFVVTGRNRLQWADTALAGQLDWTGPVAWPGLADNAGARGRQVLIGDLAPEDCQDLLARRLTTGGRPLIDRGIREVITARSHGLPLYLDLAVMRFLELRRTGRTPQPADFDHDFPALIARTLRDLTGPERHVLRAVSLLDAFDIDLATQAAGLDRQGPAVRLAERPFVGEDALALWPYHLHGLVRSSIRQADDATDDSWTPDDWHAAAQRAFTALGQQWHTAPGDRRLLVGCLRQGLHLARDHRLPPGWLTDAAWAYVDDSVWEPLAPSPGPDPTRTTTDTDAAAAAGVEVGVESGLVTPADAVVELLSALARRQHEHRERTADRLAAVTATGLLPPELADMAVYYLAKAQRDLGRNEDSRRNMAAVVAGGGRRAAAARRGLVHLARAAGDFPTALEAAQHLGWEGRQQRVVGDLWWPQGDMARAADAYKGARTEAEQHAVTGEAAIAQSMRALVLAFADPDSAVGELDLAEQLLRGHHQRATAFTIRIAGLVRDAGAVGSGIDDRARLLRTKVTDAGLAGSQTLRDLELAVCFHYAVIGNRNDLQAAISRLHGLTAGGGYAYYTDIAHFMAGHRLPEQPASRARWLDGQRTTRTRWQALVAARRDGT